MPAGFNRPCLSSDRRVLLWWPTRPRILALRTYPADRAAWNARRPVPLSKGGLRARAACLRRAAL